MDAKFKELSDQQESLVAQARALIDKAESEKRGLTQEETNQYDKIFSDIADLKVRLERHVQLAAEESRLRTAMPTLAGGKDGVPGPQPEGDRAIPHVLKRGIEWMQRN